MVWETDLHVLKWMDKIDDLNHIIACRFAHNYFFNMLSGLPV